MQEIPEHNGQSQISFCSQLSAKCCFKCRKANLAQLNDLFPQFLRFGYLISELAFILNY